MTLLMLFSEGIDYLISQMLQVHEERLKNISLFSNYCCFDKTSLL